jgi:hypothetical protein
MSTTQCQVSGLPTASIAISTPRPLVISRTVRAHGGGAVDLCLAAANRNNARAVNFGQANEHESDGAKPDHGNGVSGANARFFEPAQHTRQRLNQCRVVIAHVFRNLVSISFDDAAGNADVFGVCAVVEEQILTQILSPAKTEEARLAGRGIRRDHSLTYLKVSDALANRDNIAGQFVPEHGGGHDHSRMIPATEDLDVRAARERNLYTDQDVVSTNRWNGYRLYLQVFFAIEHGSHHVAIHCVHLVAER